MIKNLRLPELSILCSAQPFKKKKSAPKPITDQNQVNSFSSQLMAKMVLGKNARTHKSFGNPKESEAVPLKPILKNSKPLEIQDENLLENLQTIEVDFEWKKPSQKDNQFQDKIQQNIPNEKRSKFFSVDDFQVKKVGQKISRRRFLSMMGQNYPDNHVQENIKEANKRSNSKQQRRLSGSSNIQLPKNYNTVREYLDNNCLSLQNVIKSKLTKHTYLREKRNTKRKPLKIF